MTDSIPLNFLQQFLSLANAMLLLWLGPTIALGAERQRGLIWSAGAAVTGAGLFFVLHSVIVASNIGAVIANVRLWWLVGWLPVIFLPAAWYGMTLWYMDKPDRGAGDQSHRPFPPRLWDRLALFGVIALTLLVAAIFLISNPLPPGAAQLPVLQLLPNVAFAVLYPINIIVCIVLSLYTLGRPTPTAHIGGASGADGNEARARARPWLMATGAALLIVTLLVSWGVWWLLQYGHTYTLMDLYLQKTDQVVWLDVVVAAVIGVAILTLGQGIVAYEVFTGKRFPRNDLRRQWRNAIVLALGFGAVVSAALALQWRGIYIAVLAAMVVAVFYALLNWRNATARERYIEQMRPFVGSQQLYDALTLIESRDAAAQQLQALCQNVLQTELAYLVPLGRFVTLIQRTLAYPITAPALGNIPQLDEAAHQPRTMCVPLDPTRSDGLRYAVPLWGQQGWIGLLLLGPKRGKALYAQEEIEIARANGERLLDAQATSELAQRLMQAQRQRIAESQIADRRTRRVLHDDVLPRLHAAMLTTHDEGAIKALSEAHRDLAQLLRELPAVTQLQLNTRGLFGALRDLVEREFANDFDAVDWAVSPEAELAAKQLPESSAEVVFHAAREGIRNAARYGRGIERGSLHLQICGELGDGHLQVSIIDDGVGVGAASAQLGSGNGLALHSAMLAVLGGSLTIKSQAQIPGTHITLACPMNEEMGRGFTG